MGFQAMDTKVMWGSQIEDNAKVQVRPGCGGLCVRKA